MAEGKRRVMSFSDRLFFDSTNKYIVNKNWAVDDFERELGFKSVLWEMQAPDMAGAESFDFLPFLNENFLVFSPEAMTEMARLLCQIH